MTILCFTLSMPNNNAWNGQWTGENNLYARTRNLGKSQKAEKRGEGLDGENFYYNFGDGWGASVAVKVIAGTESRKIQRNSKGFCGYEWMIESIMRHGEILL